MIGDQKRFVALLFKDNTFPKFMSYCSVVDQQLLMVSFYTTNCYGKLLTF